MAEMFFRDALGRAMAEELEADPKVFLIGEEVAQYNGAYKVSNGLWDRFGDDRVIDTPIAELGFVNLGIGAAMAGMKPIVEAMTFNFAILALDGIINSASKVRAMSNGQLSCPMVLRGPNGAGGALAAQHSQSLEAQYAHIPGLTVVMPSNPADAYGLLRSAIQFPDPVIFLEHESLYGTRGEVPEEPFTVPIGEGVRKREGTDVTLIAWSRQMHQLTGWIDEIERDLEISVDLIDPRTIRPLDEDLIFSSVQKTNRVVIVEEGFRYGHIGAEISDRVQRECFDFLDAPVERVTSIDVPMPYAPPLEALVLPSLERIKDALRKVTYR